MAQVLLGPLRARLTEGVAVRPAKAGGELHQDVTTFDADWWGDGGVEDG